MSAPARWWHRRGSLSTSMMFVVLVSIVFAASCSTSTTASPGSTGRGSDTSPLPGFYDGYTVNDGARIHYVISGTGPAVVLLHGWPATWYSWAGIMPALAQHYTVIVPDLRGLGDSAPAPGAPGDYSLQALASDVHAVVRQAGFAHAEVVGHDAGGNVALDYAERYRADVTRLVVMETVPDSDFAALVKQDPATYWYAWLQRVTQDNLGGATHRRS